MGCSQPLKKELQGIYIEAKQESENSQSNTYQYKLDLKQNEFELTITHSITTRNESGGSIRIQAMSYLNGEFELKGDQSKNEELHILFKVSNASSQTGGVSFGVALPDPSSIVNFEMKFNNDNSISFVSFPKMTFSQLTGTLKYTG